MMGRKGLGITYLVVSALALAVFIHVMSRIVRIHMLPERSLYLLNELLGGRATLADLSFLGGTMLSSLAYLAASLILILIGTSILRPRCGLARLHVSCRFVLFFLIGLELWALLSFTALGGLFYAIFLGFILSFTLVQPRLLRADAQVSPSRGAISRRRIFYFLLGIISVITLVQFVLTVYALRRFSGQIIQ